jgi:arylsulfatase A-like enzyme
MGGRKIDMRNVRIRLAFVVCAVVALCCGGKPEPLNVIIIAVDTLRADHLGCYGYSRDTSPHIDDLAARGVLCERCTSPAPWTLPSFSTVFTSLYPAQHGAETVNSTLRESVPTLAGILKDHGYATGAVVNAPALKPAYGVDRGFDHYHMTPEEGRVADGTTLDALRWLDAIGDVPFFAFVHYFDPHLAYSPPTPYDKRFTVDYEGAIGYSFNLEGFSRVRDSMFVQMQHLAQADWHRIVGLYDGEIAFTDIAVAELLKGLDERSLRDNTLIVVLSDHGEEFFEHGGFEHGHTLYEELIHVPLLFSLPGRLPQGVRLSRPVRLLDVAPTILDFLNIETPFHFEGISIRPLLEGKGQPRDRGNTLLPQGVAYAEALMHGREQKCVIAFPWKLVYEMGTEQEVLFNLEEDPVEMRNIFESHPDRIDHLEGLLFQTLFGISDTWYLEIAAGQSRPVFDIEVTVEKDLMPGDINLHRILDRDGDIVDAPCPLIIDRAGSHLRLKDLSFGGSLTLAFKIYPERFPVEFDFKIDGRSAIERTYLGETLESPDAMPFTIKGRRGKVGSVTRPEARPEPPYVLLWYEESRYKGDTSIELDDETKKELRALGYIQ